MKITIALWLAIAIMFATRGRDRRAHHVQPEHHRLGHASNGTPFSDNTLTLTQVTDTSDITFDSVIPGVCTSPHSSPRTRSRWLGWGVER